MECKIIQDLLPLYAEDLCSNESSSLIEHHLLTCNECQEKLTCLKSEMQVNTIDEQEVNQYIEEKELMKHSRKRIRFEAVCNILNYIFYGVIILNFICIIIEVVAIQYGYEIKYPRMYFGKIGISYLLLILFNFLPMFISVVGRKELKGKKRKGLIILNTSLILPTILLSLISGILLFVIPPIQSYTNNVENYLVVGNNEEKYSDVYLKFMPVKIPDHAKNVEYSYRKYDGLFEEDLELSASWSLPSNEYEQAKQKVLESSYLEQINSNLDKYRVYLQGVSYPHNMKLNFTYNDKEKRLIYSINVKN